MCLLTSSSFYIHLAVAVAILFVFKVAIAHLVALNIYPLIWFHSKLSCFSLSHALNIHFLL